VRVKVLAAGVSLPDIMAREGIHPETPRVPYTPGWDLVGEVDRLSDGVSGIELGQRVAALPIHGALGSVELWREAATLVMIATVGLLAGRTWRSRAGYAAIAFGVWDLFYYVFLRLISGWPRTLLDWDILFLLPLPWWGPVLAPASIAAVMIVWGTLATQSADGSTDPRWAWALGGIGIGLALAIFMVDAWRMLPNGREAVQQVLPATFNWPLFWLALVLMASPALHQVAWANRCGQRQST